jgi:hypothetical protein
VEHRHQLRGRQLTLVAEERPCEGLEQHAAGAVGHAEAVQECRGIGVVEFGGRGGAVIGQQRPARVGVGAGQFTAGQALRPQRQCKQVQRRSGGQTRQVLGWVRRRDDRIARHRREERQLRIDTSQDRPPRVVVPEERVESVFDELLAAVGQALRPSAQPAAEMLGRLQNRYGDASFGQHHRGGYSGDPAADDCHLRSARDVARQQRIGDDQTAGPHPKRGGPACQRVAHASLMPPPYAAHVLGDVRAQRRRAPPPRP